ncbi:MAG: type IV pili methyl-accepting chemotaxis transducer N-terminal domain-containing protein, partial [Acidovorax sp.]|nr:type IV pili methyl-accepting chemotaxis transducer N-terminal domain-containing protein [Acidovorax sp.]
MTCRNQPVVSCSHQRRRMVQWVAAGVVLPTWAATAQAQMALSAAINVSGSFRALSQRMAKAYCQQHLQVMPLAALDVLAKVRKQAQAGAADLAKGSTAGAWPADLSRQLEEVQKQYTVLNTLTATAPSKASAAAVAEQADRMMTAAQTATESLEKLARARSAKLVDMAGRQRMLSQRMAKQYFLLAAGVDPKASQTQMNADAAEFKQALQA